MLTETIANLARKLVYLERGQTTILRGVRLIDGTGAPPRDHVTLVIEGDRITSIGSADAAARDDRRVRMIDGSGLTVIPGLIDCHIHFTGDTDLDPIVRYSPNVWEPYRGIVTVWDVARALEAGFTTVRSLGHGTAEQVYGLRRAVAEGLIPGPRILTSGWAISQTGGHGDPHFLPHEVTHKYRPRSAFADGPVECRRLVRQNLGDGADCIKIYTTGGSLVAAVDVKRPVPNFTLEEIRAMTDEAHAQGGHVAAHAITAEGVRNAVLGGVDTIEHGGMLGVEPDLLEMMVERGTYLDPTMKILEVLATQGPELGVRPYGVAAAQQMLEHQKGYLRRALDMGVKVVCGTDTALYERGANARELGLLVEAGFTPMQALVAATGTSAEAIRIDQHVGKLEVGKVGELVALTSDPLADIHSLCEKENIKWIFKSRSQLI
jgi:imidazolonepropionase-like amidohydrolase